MKRLAIAFCAAALLTACNSEEKKADAAGETKVASSTTTTESSTADEWVAVDSATAEKKWMEAGTPGAQHAMLAKSDGKWTAEMTNWMSPDAKPSMTKGEATNKMIFGGRYQQIDFSADFGGMPFKGTGITGYDNASKQYFTTWMDNMSTMMTKMEGPWDEATKSITFKGKAICPANGKECEMREVYKIVDDNTHVMEMYGPDMKTGKEYKSMEVKFTRKG